MAEELVLNIRANVGDANKQLEKLTKRFAEGKITQKEFETGIQKVTASLGKAKTSIDKVSTSMQKQKGATDSLKGTWTGYVPAVLPNRHGALILRQAPA